MALAIIQNYLNWTPASAGVTIVVAARPML